MLKKIIEFFERRKIISIIMLSVILLMMWYFSSLPGGSVRIITEFSWTPIIYHFTIFFSFAFFLLAIITKNKIKKKEIFLLVIISLIVSILDELHQSFVPFRDASIGDVLVDIAGVISLTAIYFLIKRIK